MTLFSEVLGLLAALLSMPVAVLSFEVFAALAIPASHNSPPEAPNKRRRIGVIVPAHNESSGLLPTLADLKSQLQPSDRLVVVADNCTDDTATIASTAGAEVIERHDQLRVGKGYALDFGLRHLQLDPPDVVIVIDADCRVEERAIDLLALTCASTGLPAQALYLMTSPQPATINHQVAEFAWRVKNWVRPLGLKALGLPCQLMGTGMAIPWEALRAVDMANGWIVEDLKLGLDLAQARYPVGFYPSARVTSEFASSANAAQTQRTRWEHGHIQTIFSLAPRLLLNAITNRNWKLLALTLDLAVPPLSLLVLLVFGSLLVTFSTWLLGLSPAPLVISAASTFLLVLAIGSAWLKFGKSVLPISAVLSVAPYALRKVGLYGRIFSGQTENRWIKTDRSRPD